jgi:mannose-6-phosphate isomerase-like protein (cupin superfamily)
MTVHMDDGTTFEINAGDAFDIPPGHDAEVTGSEPCVQLDFGGFGDYAKRT